MVRRAPRTGLRRRSGTWVGSGLCGPVTRPCDEPDRQGSDHRCRGNGAGGTRGRDERRMECRCPNTSRTTHPRARRAGDDRRGRVVDRALRLRRRPPPGADPVQQPPLRTGVLRLASPRTRRAVPTSSRPGAGKRPRASAPERRCCGERCSPLHSQPRGAATKPRPWPRRNSSSQPARTARPIGIALRALGARLTGAAANLTASRSRIGPRGFLRSARVCTGTDRPWRGAAPRQPPE